MKTETDTMPRITDPEHRKTFFNYKAAKQSAACFVCGDNDYEKIDYHHLCYDNKGRKLTGKWLAVSDMVWQNYEWEDVKSEMDKCVPLCRSCHTEYHRKLGK